MNLDRKYKTLEGKECNILQLIMIEPEWIDCFIKEKEEG